MIEKIEKFFTDLVTCLQILKIYPEAHPKFNEAINNTYSVLLDILSARDELVIGIVGEEVAFENKIFFELSKKTRQVISYLKDRGIERIVFYRGVIKEELVSFIKFMAVRKDDLTDIEAYFSSIGIKNISVGKIKVSAAHVTAEVKRSITYLKQYEDSLNKISQSLDTVLNEEELNHLELKFVVANVMDNLIGRYHEFLQLTTVKRYDVVTFMHLLNTAILSMYFSSKLGFSKDDCLNIGTATLFHDIGKIYISREIVGKSDKLTTDEFSVMKSHTILGAQILLKYVDTLGILPVVVAFEHHLKYDTKGYPHLYLSQKPHIASLIVSICDIYDALISRRSYKRDYPPDKIYDLMMREQGRVFEPSLLSKFFEIMGVWPIGTIVVLKDNSIAVVREENQEDKFCPKVEVVSPESKKRPADLKIEKDNTIMRSLNPFGEGEKYIKFI